MLKHVVILICALAFPRDVVAQVQAENASAAASTPVEPSYEVDLGLDWTWSSDRTKHWNQTLSVIGNDGQFSQLENRCDWEASTGAFRIAKDGRSLSFRPRMTADDGALHVRFRGKSNAQLSLQLNANPADGSSTEPITISVADLIAGKHTGHLQPNSPTKWRIRRRLDDVLQFNMGEMGRWVPENGGIGFSVQANTLHVAGENLSSKKLELEYLLVRVSDRNVVSEKTYPMQFDSLGNSKPVQLDDKRPDQPGVYEVRCRVVGKDKVWTRLRWSRPEYAKASQPLVVLPKQSAKNQATKIAWTQIGDIQPAKQQGWELKQWLPSNGRIPNPIGSRGPGLEQAKHNDEVVSLLESKQTYSTALPKLRLHAPYRIAFRYPAGQALQLKVEVSSSDRFDQQVRSYLLTDTSSIGEREPWQTQSILHYPSSSNEFIRLTNVSASVSSFASVEVFSQANSSAATGPESTVSRSALLRLSNLDWVGHFTRDIVMDDRDFSHGTIALHRLFVATDRLNRYTHVAGYNGVIVPANVGGRSWYASNHYSPLNDAASTTADNLQTFLHLTSANRLRVFVSADPSMALTGVESAIDNQQNAATSILRQQGGRFSSDQYDPKNPTVQRQLIVWLQDLEQRLLPHSSVQGIAVACAPDSHVASLISEPSVREPSVGDQKTEVLDGELLQRLASNLETKMLVVDAQQMLASDPITGLIVVHSAAGSDTTDRALATAIDSRSQHQHPSSVAMSKNGPETMLELTHDLAVHDPQFVVITEDKLAQQWSEEFAAALRSFTSLPTDAFDHVAGVDPAIQTTYVRHGYSDGKSVVLVMNTAPWSVDVELDCHDAIPLKSVSATQSENWSLKGDVVRTRLAAGRLFALHVANPKGRNPIKLWTSRVSGSEETLGKIKQQVTTVVERIGTLSDPSERRLIKNSGFEQPAGVGIPGWMHTQHPTGSVQIDSREAAEGSQSIVLKSEASSTTRTWIVSEQFKPTASGRVAVSLACRGELVGGSSELSSSVLNGTSGPHRLRVSIEGTRNDVPVRESNDFEVPRDGQWQSRTVVLEATGIDPTTVDSVRLTIDSLSEGKIWIDDIQIHDWFPAANERRDLQSDAFMAVQGLQTGNLTAAAELLQNYWAQYLLKQQAPIVSKPVVQIKPARKRVEPPGVAERIKGWIPRPLRF